MNHLKEVREAVIKAIPEEFAVLVKKTGNVVKILEVDKDRPIQLADVLRALPEGNWKIYTSYDVTGHLVFSNFRDIARWNLALSLDEQPEEVLAFLHNILCP